MPDLALSEPFLHCSDLQAILRIQDCELFHASVNRPNLHYEVTHFSLSMSCSDIMSDAIFAYGYIILLSEKNKVVQQSFISLLPRNGKASFLTDGLHWDSISYLKRNHYCTGQIQAILGRRIESRHGSLDERAQSGHSQWHCLLLDQEGH